MARLAKLRAMLASTPASTAPQLPSTAPPTQPASTASPAQPHPTAPQPAGHPPPTRPDTTEDSGVSPLTYVGFAVAGAGLVVGVVTGIVHLTETSSLEEECPDSVCPADKQADIDDAMTIGHVSTASLIVAGAGAILGIVGVAVSGSDEPAKSGLVLRPLVGPGFVGLGGEF